jgi:cell shape-determining protein MreC
MKASYRHNSRKPSRRWLGIALVTILLGILFPWLISKISAVVLYPFHATSTWIKTSDGVFPLYLRSKSELQIEVERLRAKLATEAATQTSFNRLLQENMQLRSMARAGREEERLVARVLARPDYLAYDLLQIDKGTLDGVVVGAPVYTGVDSVIGLVVHTTPRYAFVDLFTSPGFESTAYIFGPNVFAPIEGLGGGVARVKLPQGVAIAEGQLVILPGVSNGVYGEIVGVQNEPTQPQQYGYISPPLSMNNLLYVSVGLKSVENRTAEEIDETVRTVLRESLRLSTTTMSSFASSSQIFIEEDDGVIEIGVE